MELSEPKKHNSKDKQKLKNQCNFVNALTNLLGGDHACGFD